MRPAEKHSINGRYMTAREISGLSGICLSVVHRRLKAGIRDARIFQAQLRLALPRARPLGRRSQLSPMKNGLELAGIYGANVALVVALKLVRRFGDKTPTKEQLMQQFECSRATAYRWIAAWKQAVAQ